MNVVLVDDHPVMREALRALLPVQNPSIEVVGEAANAREAVSVVELLAPEVVVLDLVMPGSNGVAAIRDLRGMSQCRIVVYSALALPSVAIDAISAGADAYVVKCAPIEDLMIAMEVAPHERRSSSHSLEDGVGHARPDRSGLSSLSRREREIFDLIIHGNTNIKMADRLFISVKTVETHRTRINRKLGVHSTGELIRFAALNGLVTS